VEALSQGQPHRLLTLVVAGFCRYLRGVDEQAQPIVVQDGRADELRQLATQSPADPRPLLSVSRVFGDLGQNEAWVAELTASLQHLDQFGAKSTIRSA
jgi:fructuronate reductase/mannitol 2-dehydrogenase